jgi:hypothetical protein
MSLSAAEIIDGVVGRKRNIASRKSFLLEPSKIRGQSEMNETRNTEKLLIILKFLIIIFFVQMYSTPSLAVV